RTGVRLLAAAVLVLHIEGERLAAVEPGERAVEERCRVDAEGGRAGFGRGIELEQRLEGSLGAASPRETDAAGRAVHAPARGQGRVPVKAVSRLYVDQVPLHLHRAHQRRVRPGLEHGDEARTPP